MVLTCAQPDAVHDRSELKSPTHRGYGSDGLAVSVLIVVLFVEIPYSSANGSLIFFEYHKMNV